MRVGIVGTRTFDDYELMKETLEAFNDIDEIISGGANGADTLANNYSKEFLGKEATVFEAEWDNLEAEPCKIKYRKDGSPFNVLAGFNRNSKIVENSDKIIAFWDSKSTGTLDTITKAYNKDIDVLVIHYDIK